MKRTKLTLISIFLLLSYSIGAIAKDSAWGVSAVGARVLFMDEDDNKWGEDLDGLYNGALGLSYYNSISKKSHLCFSTSGMLGAEYYGVDATISFSRCGRENGNLLGIGVGLFADNKDGVSMSGTQFFLSLGYMFSDFGITLIMKDRSYLGDPSGLDEYAEKTKLNVPNGYSPEYSITEVRLVYPF